MMICTGTLLYFLLSITGVSGDPSIQPSVTLQPSSSPSFLRKLDSSSAPSFQYKCYTGTFGGAPPTDAVSSSQEQQPLYYYYSIDPCPLYYYVSLPAGVEDAEYSTLPLLPPPTPVEIILDDSSSNVNESLSMSLAEPVSVDTAQPVPIRADTVVATLGAISITNPPTPPPTPFPTNSPTSTPTPFPTNPPTSPRPSAAPSVSAAPTSSPTSPTASPSVHPSNDLDCEDIVGVPFIINETMTSGCTFLYGRTDVQQQVCRPGHQAWDLCEDVCGKCTDWCPDNNKGTFTYANGERNCQWLKIRYRDSQAICDKTPAARELCKDTCNVCLPPSATPSSSPSNSLPSSPPSSSPTPKETQSPTVRCVDDLRTRFSAVKGSSSPMGENCIWLQARPSLQEELCKVDSIASICIETCGQCTPLCEDSVEDPAYFDENGNGRTCAYLSIRYRDHTKYCNAGSDAWKSCVDTCQNCPA